jgi:hypothetical protein
VSLIVYGDPQLVGLRRDEHQGGEQKLSHFGFSSRRLAG